MDNKSFIGEKVFANKGSLIQSIKTFETSLVDMKSTVLVPTRLNDIDFETETKNGFNNHISGDKESLFYIYNDLKKMSKILYGDTNWADLKHSDGIDINGNNNNCKNLNDGSLPNNDNMLAKLEFHVKQLKSILDVMTGTADKITTAYKEDVQNMHMNYNHIEYNNNDVKHYYTSNSSNEQIN